jgi:hypothetical protein
MSSPKADCQLERSEKAQGSQNVGEHLVLTCNGSWSPALEKTAQVKAPEGSEYSLWVLNILESEPNHLKAVVTSYGVGQHQNESFEISDGRTSVLTSPLNFTVESVIDPKEQTQGQPPKPFDPFGPFAMGFPLWIWLALGSALLLVAGVIGLSVWWARRRARLKQELEKFMTMLSPFNQFSKDLRANTKRLQGVKNEAEIVDLIKKLDEDFRLFLVRELKVPALQGSNQNVLREIKRSHGVVYEAHQRDLRRILFEFEKAKMANEKVKIDDCQELIILSRQVVDRIYSLRRTLK